MNFPLIFHSLLNNIIYLLKIGVFIRRQRFSFWLRWNLLNIYSPLYLFFLFVVANRYLFLWFWTNVSKRTFTWWCLRNIWFLFRHTSRCCRWIFSLHNLMRLYCQQWYSSFFLISWIWIHICRSNFLRTIFYWFCMYFFDRWLFLDHILLLRRFF